MPIATPTKPATRIFSPQRLKLARHAAGLTTEALALGIGKARRSVIRYESGHHAPTADALGALSAVLGVPVDVFYTDAM